MPPDQLNKPRHLSIDERRQKIRGIREHFEEIGMFKKKEV